MLLPLFFISLFLAKKTVHTQGILVNPRLGFLMDALCAFVACIQFTERKRNIFLTCKERLVFCACRARWRTTACRPLVLGARAHAQAASATTRQPLLGTRWDSWLQLGSVYIGWAISCSRPISEERHRAYFRGQH